ncbi:thiosulfate:glutathione sulfurtransferase isoform X4 [Hydra vulgaris]|uniref:Thiosulfate:glutathione sulfurtransferase isoform X4 n=1 Tax=Hydra vulgaris TaxID=6087 RepID=A0ABM4CNC8_HYDVU
MLASKCLLNKSFSYCSKRCLWKKSSCCNKVFFCPNRYMTVHSATTLSISKLCLSNAKKSCNFNVFKQCSSNLCSSSTSSSDLYEIDVDLLNEALKNNNIYIVDVRDRQEIKDSGELPNAINIPYELEAALQLNENHFKVRYGTSPPNDDGNNLVFSCRSGRRSYHALMLAHSMGYLKAKHLKGGYLAWSSPGS